MDFAQPTGLVKVVVFAETVTRTMSLELSAYPRWLVVLIGTFVAVLVIWIGMKLLKWTLWLLLFGVLAAGVIWSMRLYLQ